MSYGSSKKIFSQCSVKDLKAHYSYVTTVAKAPWCMESMSTLVCFLNINYIIDKNLKDIFHQIILIFLDFSKWREP